MKAGHLFFNYSGFAVTLAAYVVVCHFEFSHCHLYFANNSTYFPHFCLASSGCYQMGLIHATV